MSESHQRSAKLAHWCRVVTGIDWIERRYWTREARETRELAEKMGRFPEQQARLYQLAARMDSRAAGNPPRE